MYRFEFKPDTHSIYFKKGQYDTPLFHIDTFKKQEHVLLYACVRLRDWLNAVCLTIPSKSVLDIKFNKYCIEGLKK